MYQKNAISVESEKKVKNEHEHPKIKLDYFFLFFFLIFLEPKICDNFREFFGPENKAFEFFSRQLARTSAPLYF